jgi:AraC-like DNA-binding protein
MRWQAMDVRVNSAGRVLCEPHWRLGEAWSKSLRDFDLWLVWRGSGSMRTHFGPVELRPGLCMWMRPGGTYLAGHDPHDPLGVIYIHFDLLQRGQALRRWPLLPREMVEVTDLQFFETVGRRIVELMRRPDEQGRTSAAHLLRGLLLDYDTLATAPPVESAHERQQRAWIGRVAARIDERPGEGLGVAALAQQAGYSADHFSRLFRRWMGVGPAEYQVRARIARARQLLVETDLTIGEIAETLGYRDIYFFSRQFREKTAESPTTYRRRRSG